MKPHIDPFWRDIQVPNSLGRPRQRDALNAVHARVLGLLGCFCDEFLQHIAGWYDNPIRMCALAELTRRREMEK